MNTASYAPLLLSIALRLSGCGDSAVADPGDVSSDVPATTPDLPAPADLGGRVETGDPPGAGTCADPIDLSRHGTRKGNTLVYRGSTIGQGDLLHPYEGCVLRDAAETVLRYPVPAGTQGLEITTAGSEFDTALYVRTACSQVAGGADLVCNNDNYDGAPRSTVFVTNILEGQVLFIVVDGNAAETAPAQGRYVLTVRSVTAGTPGEPCRAPTDPPTAQCSAGHRCSEGGAADGSAICVPTVANEASCDPRQYNNICLAGSTCVTDPNAPEGTAPTSRCSLPGVRQGAQCREASPRCVSPFACSAGEEPRCVAVMGRGLECDPTGENNRCAVGLRCAPLGDGGAAICN